MSVFPLKFPEGFLWGAATAAHQVEGHNVHSDWWAWEQTDGRIANGHRSGAACDHWNRYAGDFDLAASMHHNAHRFSIGWSRVQPARGVLDEAALQHYVDVVDTLRARGMEPVVTLHHFVLPQWVAEEGGWQSRRTIGRFLRFVRIVLDALGGRVRWWVTLNEPVIQTVMAHVKGAWPPGGISLLKSVRMLLHLARAHARAYRLIHARLGDDVQVGVAKHVRLFDSSAERPALDRFAARLQHLGINGAFVSALREGRLGRPGRVSLAVTEAAGTFDYWGLNYYSRDLVAFRLSRWHEFLGQCIPAPGALAVPFGQFCLNEVYPHGLTRAVRWLAADRRPILITENGVPDADDTYRPLYILSHLAALWKAVQDGADVRGYLHWSLMDNFEWAEGFEPRFGLAHTDFQTQRRTIRPSGRMYGDICRTNAVTQEMIEQHAASADGYIERLATTYWSPHRIPAAR
jgi:beta-glucosidase